MPSSAKPYFTISADLLPDRTATGKPGIDPRINLNIYLSNVGLLTPALFEKLSQLKNDYIFSIAPRLINDSHNLQEVLFKLYLLLSFNLFAKESELTIPIFSNDRASSEVLNTTSVIRFFHEQGIVDIQMPFFEYPGMQNNIQHAGNCTLLTFPSKSSNDAHACYPNGELENKHSDLTIIAFDEEPADLILFDEIVHRFTRKEGDMNVPFHFDNLSGPYIDRDLYEEEKKRWKKRALLYQDFLQLSKTVQEKEYYEVLNWYHKEYEILPLWYKRFGHIIKVLMGKRTFRSLFNDRVKKYKD